MVSRGPTTLSLEERIDALSGEMQELNKGVRDFGGDLRWIKRIGAFVAVTMVAALAGSGRVIWEASAVDTKVDQQGRVLEELRADAKQRGGRVEAVERRLDRIDGRLDAMGKQLDTLLGRAAPKAGQ